MKLLILVIAILLAGCSPDTTTNSASGAAVPSREGSFTDERFNAVRKSFEEAGARVERDPQARSTVRVYLPWSVATDISKIQAQQMAALAQSRLGPNAIVYMKNERGDTLAKATPWGLE